MNALVFLLVTLGVLAALPLPYSIEAAPPLRRAPVTLLLLAINGIVFLVTHISLSHGLVEPIQAFNDYGLTPADVDPLQLVTYSFLHVSGAHILWNMAYLYLFGPYVEQKVGSLLYAAMYLLGGAAAGLINSAIVVLVAGNSSDAYVPVVGASGAISTVLGLFTVFAATRPMNCFWAMGYLTGQRRHRLEIPALFGIALWLVQTVYGAAMSLVNDDNTGVAYFTHLGGFVVGILLGLAAKYGRARWSRPRVVSAPDDGRDRSQTSIIEPARSNPCLSLIDLLSRAIDDRDPHRAATLLTKCQAMGVTVPEPLINQLEALKSRPAPPRELGSGGGAVLPKN